jgi:recombination protein RecR
MKHILPQSIDRLIEQLSHLPGIGPKSASRLTFSLLARSKETTRNLSEAIAGLKEGLKNCPECFLITDQDLCVVCSDTGRDSHILCIVEESLDVVAIESSHGFKGYYHVLGGVMSPIDGIGPDQLSIRELISRVKKSDNLEEIIIATNPSLEGEATALYISEQLKDMPVKISRIARGLPSGGDLEYADEVTLQRALEGRQTVKES